VISGTDGDCCLHHVQTDSRVSAMSPPMGTGIRMQGVEWPGHKTDTYVHLGPRLGMCGTVTAFMCMSSWHDANQVSTGTTVLFYL
jgi:hypothetical protein